MQPYGFNAIEHQCWEPSPGCALISRQRDTVAAGGPRTAGAPPLFLSVVHGRTQRANPLGVHGAGHGIPHLQAGADDCAVRVGHQEPGSACFQPASD